MSNSIFSLLSKALAAETILVLGEGYINYSDIMGNVTILAKRVSPTTLKSRLEDLVELGYVEKKPIEDRNREEYTYHPTEQLQTIAEALQLFQKIISTNEIETDSKISKYRGEKSLKLEINLPEQFRELFEDDQILKTRLYEIDDDIVVHIMTQNSGM